MSSIIHPKRQKSNHRVVDIPKKGLRDSFFAPKTKQLTVEQSAFAVSCLIYREKTRFAFSEKIIWYSSRESPRERRASISVCGSHMG